LPSGRNIHRRPNAKTWGVDPDVAVPLTLKEQMEIEDARRQAEVIRGGLTTSATATAATVEARKIPSPKPLIIDRQLAKALDLLRTDLTTQPVTTTQGQVK